jgi:hypothetical protein
MSDSMKFGMSNFSRFSRVSRSSLWIDIVDCPDNSSAVRHCASKIWVWQTLGSSKSRSFTASVVPSTPDIFSERRIDWAMYKQSLFNSGPRKSHSDTLNFRVSDWIHASRIFRKITRLGVTGTSPLIKAVRSWRVGSNSTYTSRFRHIRTGLSLSNSLIKSW